tara:strand:- start:370 stop:591 length:222 start_codon:yes stop_codon:yes gene_type:complete
MKIMIGDIHYYELDLDTDDLQEARKMAVEWLLGAKDKDGASGDEKIKHSKGCEVVQELDNGILVKIEEKYHED